MNVSEGRRADVVAALTAAAGAALLDVHVDPDHHRSVLTLAGDEVEDATRAVARVAVARIDLSGHAGAHPRIGALDVVPFVPFPGSEARLDDAVGARDRFARWAADELGLPSFLYGCERSLPEVRRGAFRTLRPDAGPPRPHPSAGAVAVGARPVLVAYNLWLAEADLGLARRVAAELRSPAVRALGLGVGSAVQVSCNLVDPASFGPADAYDAVARRAAVARAELVGLVPAAVLAAAPERRWAELDLDPSRTVEARLAAAPRCG